ncbi:MAG: hypothetical protein Q9207_004965 [Kuettlingeria erythrocarpa]
MDKCIGHGMRGKIYAHAKCRWAVSLQAVAVTCVAPDDHDQQVTIVQACIGDEICVETGFGDDYYIAYCISTRNFMHLPATETAHGSGRWRIHGAAQKLLGAEDYTANVLLADESRKSRMLADTLEAVAWIRRPRSRVLQVGEASDGSGEHSLADRRVKAALCRQCSRLLMQPVPIDANLLTVAEESTSMLTSQLPILLFLLLLSPLSSLAWICFPPPHLLPPTRDCLTRIAGIDYLSNMPREQIRKRWGRHFASTAMTERLPKWYWIDNRGEPNACAIVVDVDDRYATVVDIFRLEDVARAATEVYAQCLLQRGQIGLDFPSEEGRAFAKVMRLVGPPPVLRLGAEMVDEEKKKNVRRLILPNGRGVLFVSDTEPGGRHNVSATR